MTAAMAQPGNGKPLAQFDLIDGKKGFSKRTINGVAYWLGSDTGITHTFTDTTAVSGQTYAYIVRAINSKGEESQDSNETIVTIP